MIYVNKPHMKSAPRGLAKGRKRNVETVAFHPFYPTKLLNRWSAATKPASSVVVSTRKNALHVLTGNFHAACACSTSLPWNTSGKLRSHCTMQIFVYCCNCCSISWVRDFKWRSKGAARAMFSFTYLLCRSGHNEGALWWEWSEAGIEQSVLRRRLGGTFRAQESIASGQWRNQQAASGVWEVSGFVFLTLWSLEAGQTKANVCIYTMTTGSRTTSIRLLRLAFLAAWVCQERQNELEKSKKLWGGRFGWSLLYLCWAKPDSRGCGRNGWCSSVDRNQLCPDPWCNERGVRHGA